jgi:tetratricopeptide (TPR) repeat protein
MAGVHRLEGRTASARQQLNEALRLDPAYLAARLELVRISLEARDSKAALETLDATPANQRNDVRVLAPRNWVLMMMGELREARAGVDLGLRLSTAPVFALQDGSLKLQQGDPAAARAVAEDLLKKNPDDLDAARLLVAAFARHADWPAALKRVRELSAQRPQSAALQELLGGVLMDSGDTAGARKAYQAAIDLQPARSSARLILAEMDRRDGRLDMARRNVEAVLAMEARSLGALLLAAQIELDAGNQPAAMGRYRAVLNVQDTNVLALNNLACLAAASNPEEALKLAQQALSLAPDSAVVQDTLGWIYYRKGFYTTAVEHLKLAVAKEPTPRHQFHLAVSYIKTGNRDLGQRLLATALKQDPSLTKTEQGW